MALSRSRFGAGCGLVQRLELEDRVTRRQIIEGFHGRSLRYRKEALHVACESLEIGFDDRRTHAGGKFVHGIAQRRHRADEHDFARRAGMRTQSE